MGLHGEQVLSSLSIQPLPATQQLLSILGPLIWFGLVAEVLISVLRKRRVPGAWRQAWPRQRIGILILLVLAPTWLLVAVHYRRHVASVNAQGYFADDNYGGKWLCRGWITAARRVELESYAPVVSRAIADRHPDIHLFHVRATQDRYLVPAGTPPGAYSPHRILDVTWSHTWVSYPAEKRFGILAPGVLWDTVVSTLLWWVVAMAIPLGAACLAKF